MNKIIDSNLSKLLEYLQSHREKSSLSLKVKFNTNKHQNLQKIKLIEEELGKLTHLTYLTLKISNHTILTAEGYRIISNAVLNLKELQKLSIQIDQRCFLENEGLSILSDMINHLPELEYLSFQINKNNFITAEFVQRFLDSLVGNIKLTTLKLFFHEFESYPTTNEGNINFWRGLSNLKHLEKLKLYLNIHKYGSSDLIELFQHIANLKNLRNLNLIFSHINNIIQAPCLLDELFPQIGKMVQLRSLKINYGIIVLHLDSNIIKFNLNEVKRNTILRNLNNLKFLEKLNLYRIDELLFNENFGEYANVIKELKSIKWDIEKNIVNRYPNQLTSIGQSLLQLKNLNNLDLTITLEMGQLSQFLLDLSASFNFMHNLLCLKLGFKCDLNSNGFTILGESFNHLKSLEQLDLMFQYSQPQIKVNKSVFWNNLRKVSNLKNLKIILQGYRFKEDEEEYIETDIILDSIGQLIQLERLYLEILYLERQENKQAEDGYWNLESLSNTLTNLTQLKELRLALYLNQLYSAHQLNQIKACFENLEDLEHLDLKIYIKEKNYLQESPSFVNCLTHLKSIAICFNGEHYDIFGSSVWKLQKLEDVSITYCQEITVYVLIDLLESLPKSSIRKLNLYLYSLVWCLEHKERLQEVFSKMSSLEKLYIYEIINGNLMMYIHGIKQMKQLKSLNITSYQSILTGQDIQELELSLKTLNNLEKLTIKSFAGYVITEASDIPSFKSLQAFGNIKHFNFYFSHHIEDDNINRDILVNQACSLDIDQLNSKSSTMNWKDKNLNQNADVVDLQKSKQRFSMKQIYQLIHSFFKIVLDQIKIKAKYFYNCLKLDDNQLIAVQELNPTSIKLNISHENFQRFEFTLNEFDFLHLAYLNKLEIRFILKKTQDIKLKIMQPLKDLINESKLQILVLQLGNLILNEEQITYLSRNFQFLSNLQLLFLETSFGQNYLDLLFDSFKYLINLEEIQVSSAIYEERAASLGNSLRSMSKLLGCSLIFNWKSTFESQSISSILNGLKEIKKLKYLDLQIQSNQYIKGDSQIPISECISNLNLLQFINFSLKTDHGRHLINKTFLSEFFTSIGSLVFLSCLKLEINEENPLHQEMLDKLIKSMCKLKNLSTYVILVDLNYSNPLSQDFATLFNMEPNMQLTITAEKYYKKTTFKQSEEKYFQFQNYYYESKAHIFFEYLNENIDLLFLIEDNKILNEIKMCTARKIKLHSINLRYEYDIYSLCSFLSKIPHTIQLRMRVNISDLSRQSDRKKVFQVIAQSLAMLNNVQFLKLKFTSLFEPQIGNNDLMIVLNSLKKLKQLYQLTLKTDSEQVNSEMEKKIKRLILRQVKFPFEKEVDY